MYVAGNGMWIAMNWTDGLSHAIVNVKYVDDSADISRNCKTFMQVIQTCPHVHVHTSLNSAS